MKDISNPQKTNHIKCIICDKLLTGRQTMFCSPTCKNKSTNNKNQNYIAQQKRGLDRKIQLMKLLGNCCAMCGYAKNYAGLSFHHKDPSLKLFQLDMRSCSNRTWDKLLTEVEKCQLLCLNCHAELHNPNLYLD